MKTIILAFSFVAVIYLAWVPPIGGTQCTVNGECNATTVCLESTSPICQHPAGDGIVQGGGLCTCPDSSCVLATDCYGNKADLTCEDNARHCYDEKCICSRFPIGK